jgi:hypothetical protein
MSNPDREAQFFEMFSESASMQGEGSRSSLKARVYTALIGKQQESGPLMDLQRTKRSGRELCVFEELVQIVPVGQTAKSSFICRACHARILAENLDDPPIFWPGCPYVVFKKS